MQITAILLTDNDRSISRLQGGLPWNVFLDVHLQDSLKEAGYNPLSKSERILMGYNTYLTVMGLRGRPLFYPSGALHTVVTARECPHLNWDSNVSLTSLEEVIRSIDEEEGRYFLVGGFQLFVRSLYAPAGDTIRDHIDTIHLYKRNQEAITKPNYCLPTPIDVSAFDPGTEEQRDYYSVIKLRRRTSR